MWSTLAYGMPFKVVIDPGHGGSDFGTIYRQGAHQVTEKRLTLMLAKQVAIQLRAKGAKVLLTRTTDREVDLPTRTRMANRQGADAFISIHMNSTEAGGNPSAEGVETFILNNTSNASSKRLARLENSVLSTQPIHSSSQMDVALILKDLRLDGNLIESKRLACSVQQKLVHTTAKLSSSPKFHRDRGVKQALFHVLLGADMPSILVEVGFLSSPIDRALVLSPQGRYWIGKSIANAVLAYYSRTESSSLSLCKVR